jgi:hypothetical protein
MLGLLPLDDNADGRVCPVVVAVIVMDSVLVFKSVGTAPDSVLQIERLIGAQSISCIVNVLCDCIVWG